MNGLTAQTVQSTLIKCVKKGTFSLNGFYGGTYLFDEAMNKRQYMNDIKCQNNIGINCEYMINKIVGLGLEYTYTRSRINEYSNFYGCGTPPLGNPTKILISTDNLIKQRALIKINFHFATTKYFDAYTTLGLGYKNVREKNDVKTNDHLITDRTIDYYHEHKPVIVFNPTRNSAINNLLMYQPIAIRIGVGLRYYFIKNLGVGIEAGIGGPIIQGGLSLKL